MQKPYETGNFANFANFFVDCNSNEAGDWMKSEEFMIAKSVEVSRTSVKPGELERSVNGAIIRNTRFFVQVRLRFPSCGSILVACEDGSISFRRASSRSGI